jgi:hypothetical protein
VNRLGEIVPIDQSVLRHPAQHLATHAPRLHAAVRDLMVVLDSDATASVAYDGERLHLARTVTRGPFSNPKGRNYALAVIAEMIDMDAIERVGGRDARTWNAACMMVAVANLRMSGVFRTPEECAPFDVPMYDGMKPSVIYERLVDRDRAPRQMIGVMTKDDL